MKKMMTKEALIIFIKNPILGKVKTRISKDTGPEKALDIYLELLTILEGNILSIPQNKILFYSNHVEENDQWSQDIFDKHIQNGSDIGSRMAHAFEQIFEHYNSIVLIGSDCPSISKEIIQTAFIQLEKNDIVLGPALDGGYYLIGMKKFHPPLFKGISWSTDKVYKQTVKEILDLDLSLATVPMLSDIDTLNDWEDYLGGNIE